MKKYTTLGFSMIEIFIALTISLILLAGVLQVFLNSKINANLVNGFSQLQENGRFIDQYLMRIIRLAGYRSPPSGSNFQAMSTIFPTATTYITGTHGTGLNASDTLTIRYQGSGNGTGTPDGSITDCLNNAADSNTLVTNTFSLTANNELQCQATNANSATPNSTQILISGVENFQVLYGEDLNGDNTPDRYVPANYAFINWNDVVSVRLALLLRSDDPVDRLKNTTSYYLLGTNFTHAADNYVRTPLIFTILLRNLMVNPN